MSEWPKSVITVKALIVKSELDEDDQGAPRVIEARLADEPDGLGREAASHVMNG